MQLRIGVNGGSLRTQNTRKISVSQIPEALVESAMNNIKILEDNDYFNFKISVKASDVFLATKVIRNSYLRNVIILYI